MRKLVLAVFLLTTGSVFSQDKAHEIDLNNWKLELPTGYTASDWKLSNFQKDRFAKPFFYIDSLDGSLVMEAYPAEGKSKAKYTKNTLREQMQAGSSDVNWTMKQGAILETELQVVEISKDASGDYDRTILIQIDGRTTDEQTEELGLTKPVSMPFLKLYWQDEFLRVARRVLKDNTMVGDGLLMKNSWEEADAVYSREKIGFDKVKIRIEVRKGRVAVHINEEKPIVFKGLSVSQWYFENYFTVGNYLQSKDENAKCIVKYYELKVTHEAKK